MLIAVETMIQAMIYVLQVVPVGTNIGLLRVMWAMSKGSFLQSRGAIHSALAESGFGEEAIQQSWSAVSYGAWSIDELLSRWSQQVASSNQWCERRYEGYRVRSIDLTAFWRPCLQGQVSQHYNSTAQKAMPAIVFGIMSISGATGKKRLPLLSGIVRCEATMSEGGFQHQLLQTVAKTSRPDEVNVLDAGFSLAALQANQVKRFVLRLAQNCTARRNVLPDQKRGRPAQFGERIRPLVRTHRGKRILATIDADASGEFDHQGRTIRYRAWHHLVTSETKVNPTHQTFSLYLFHDPRYTNPLLLATDMRLTAHSIFRVYLERWSVEQAPLAAKQMIGLHRQFVFGDESRYRLPELALLTGNILAQVAAQLPPLSTGFWDRLPQATPGRLRRVLSSALFPNLVEIDPQFRKKQSVTHHLPKGILGHRRTKLAA